MSRIPLHAYDFFGYLASGLVVAVGMELILGFPSVLGRQFTVFESAFVLIAVYVAGQIVAIPAKAILEDGLIHRFLGPPSKNLVSESAPRLRSWLFPGYYKSLPRNARSNVLKRAKSEGLDEDGEDLFLHVRYHPRTLGNEKLMARLGDFLNQYGFSRNLALAALLVGLGLMVRNWLFQESPSFGAAVLFLVSGVFLFYRYLKFFRQYSYELFNTYGRGDQ